MSAHNAAAHFCRRSTMPCNAAAEGAGKSLQRYMRISQRQTQNTCMHDPTFATVLLQRQKRSGRSLRDSVSWGVPYFASQASDEDTISGDLPLSASLLWAGNLMMGRVFARGIVVRQHIMVKS